MYCSPEKAWPGCRDPMRGQPASQSTLSSSMPELVAEAHPTWVQMTGPSVPVRPELLNCSDPSP